MMSQDRRVQEVTTVSRVPQEKLVTTRTVIDPPIGYEHPAKTYEKKKVIFRTYQAIWYILGVVEVLLAFRLLLKLLGANPASGFTNLVYVLSDPFAVPFLGVLPTSVSSGSAVEWSTFIAMIVYAIVAIGVIELTKFIKPTNPEEVRQNVDSV